MESPVAFRAKPHNLQGFFIIRMMSLQRCFLVAVFASIGFCNLFSFNRYIKSATLFIVPFLCGYQYGATSFRWKVHLVCLPFFGPGFVGHVGLSGSVSSGIRYTGPGEPGYLCSLALIKPFLISWRIRLWLNPYRAATSPVDKFFIVPPYYRFG